MYHVKRMVKMIKEIPNGVFPTMLTPFTDGNKIDYNGVEQILNWYSEKKTDGIFAICQSSEIFYLSFEERYDGSCAERHEHCRLRQHGGRH